MALNKVTDLHGREMQVIPGDFETYYDKEYSLSRMSTTLYVRGDKFQCHGMSVGYPDPENPVWITNRDLPDFLNSIDWSQHAFLAHNCPFDAFILSQHFNIFPAFYLDTASMSRGEYGISYRHSLDSLAERLGHGNKFKDTLAKTAGIANLTPEMEELLAKYAIQDSVLLWECWKSLYGDRGYPEKELHVIHHTVKAFADPKLLVDAELCREEIEEEAKQRSALIANAGVPVEHLSSNPKFAQLLLDRGVEPPRKVSERTGRTTFAFAKNDLEFQALMADDRVNDLVQARLAVKSTIGRTRAGALLQHGRPTLPVMLNYCNAITHRWTGGDRINPQNLPSGRKGGSKRLRQALKAPPGYKFIHVDSSQIECRVSAELAGEEELLGIFRRKEDPYCDLASRIFERPVVKGVDFDLRQVGKTGELALQFGVGAPKFRYMVRSGAQGPPVDIDEETASKAVRTYRDSRSEIVKAWDRVEGMLIRMCHMTSDQQDSEFIFVFENDRILMPNQLWLHYRDLCMEYDAFDRPQFAYTGREGASVPTYGAKVWENIVQSVARTIVAEQTMKVAERYPDIVLLVHDEADFLVCEDEAEEAAAYALDCFRTPPVWLPNIPIDGEVEIWDSYGG